MQSTPKDAAERGTTLLEALIVCSLVALITAIAVPTSRSLRAPFAVRSATRQVEADLQTARMRAITRSARYRLAFNNAGTGYLVQRETSTNTFATEGGLQRLPSGVTLNGVTGTALFDTRGMTAAGASISLRADGAHTKTVTLNVLGQTTIN